MCALSQIARYIVHYRNASHAFLQSIRARRFSENDSWPRPTRRASISTDSPCSLVQELYSPSFFGDTVSLCFVMTLASRPIFVRSFRCSTFSGVLRLRE
jgi:hypothetical protein